MTREAMLLEIADELGLDVAEVAASLADGYYRGYVITPIQTKNNGWYAEYEGVESGQTYFYADEAQAVKQAKSPIDSIERTRV